METRENSLTNTILIGVERIHKGKWKEKCLWQGQNVNKTREIWWKACSKSSNFFINGISSILTSFSTKLAYKKRDSSRKEKRAKKLSTFSPTHVLSTEKNFFFQKITTWSTKFSLSVVSAVGLHISLLIYVHYICGTKTRLFSVLGYERISWAIKIFSFYELEQKNFSLEMLITL